MPLISYDAFLLVVYLDHFIASNSKITNYFEIREKKLQKDRENGIVPSK